MGTMVTFMHNNQRFRLCFTILALTLFLTKPFAQQTDRDTIPGSAVSFDMVYMPGGAFQIGGQTVQLTPFWIGAQEVPYDAFNLFYKKETDTNASLWKDGVYKADAVLRPTPQYLDYTFGMGTTGGVPSVSMTQQGALRFCYWLYMKTGEFYRLPTEAEWEYACRAGAPGDLPEGTTLEKMDEFAWTYENSFEKYHPAGEKKPNPWGLYDMLGNVSEWTLDEYADDYYQKLGAMSADPWLKPSQRHSRTVKGGSFDTPAAECTCTARQKSEPRWQARDPQIPKSKWWNTDSSFLGFRLVKPVTPMSREAIEAFFAEAIKD